MGRKALSSMKHFKKFLLVLNFGSGKTMFFLVFKIWDVTDPSPLKINLVPRFDRW